MDDVKGDIRRVLDKISESSEFCEYERLQDIHSEEALPHLVTTHSSEANIIECINWMLEKIQMYSGMSRRYSRLALKIKELKNIMNKQHIDIIVIYKKVRNIYELILNYKPATDFFESKDFQNIRVMNQKMHSMRILRLYKKIAELDELEEMERTSTLNHLAVPTKFWRDSTYHPRVFQYPQLDINAPFIPPSTKDYVQEEIVDPELIQKILKIVSSSINSLKNPTLEEKMSVLNLVLEKSSYGIKLAEIPTVKRTIYELLIKI